MAMNQERMDEILGTEAELLPSSGFLATVMDRVRQEAVTPRPIPFPWIRALPGILLFVAVAGWAAYLFAGFAVQGVQHISASSLTANGRVYLSGLDQGSRGLVLAGVALAVSLVSWLLSSRLASRSRVF